MRIVIFATLVVIALGLPLKTKFYPRILARGIQHSTIYFYKGSRRLTLTQAVQKPNKLPRPEDTRLSPIWNFIRKLDRFQPPPFDRTTSDNLELNYDIVQTETLTTTKVTPSTWNLTVGKTLPKSTSTQTPTTTPTTTTPTTTTPTTTVPSTTTLTMQRYRRTDTYTDLYLERRMAELPDKTAMRRLIDGTKIPWECDFHPYRQWFEQHGGVCALGDWQMPRYEKRTKRELPWDCSWPPTRLFFEWKGGVCAEGVSEEMKKILIMMTKQQDKDRHSISGIKQLTDIIMEDEHKLTKELIAVEDAVNQELKFADSRTKAMARISLQIVSELAYSNVLQTYSNLWKASQRPTIGVGDVPAPMKEAILQAADEDKSGYIRQVLEKNTRALLNPMVAFKGMEDKIQMSLTTHLPEITRTCQVYQLQSIGLTVGGQCMSGPDISGTAVVECDDESWLVASDCLSACYESASKEFFCQINECINSGPTPDWLDKKPMEGPLIAPRVAEYTLCYRQPALLYVGNNKYLLTHDRHVKVVTESTSFDGVKAIERDISGRAGMIFNASCSGHIRIVVKNTSFIGPECDDKNEITADVGVIALKDETMYVASEINEPTDWTSFTKNLKAETLVQQLNKSTHMYYQIGTKVDANLKDASEIQLKLATKVRNIDTTEYTAIRLSERIAMGITIIMSTFNAIAICFLCRLIPTAGRPFIPINHIEIEEQPSAPLPTPPPQYKRQHFTINNPWSELSADETRMVREMMQSSQFCNLSDREIATFVANTNRKGGSRNNDPISRTLLGMD